MGFSTNAYLFWGFTFDSPDREIRLRPLWAEDGPWAEEGGERVWGYWPYWSDVEKVARLKEIRVVLDAYCSKINPSWFVSLQDACHRAWRGHSLELPGLALPMDARERLHEACNLMVIPWQDPKWWLVSYWG
jgi:hypothetical protein